MTNIYYYSDGTTSERRDDSKILHREDGPAIEWEDGDKFWYINGKVHRENGPALEFHDGSKEWYLDQNGYSRAQYYKIMKEVREMPLELRLVDPREWVRKFRHGA